MPKASIRGPCGASRENAGGWGPAGCVRRPGAAIRPRRAAQRGSRSRAARGRPPGARRVLRAGGDRHRAEQRQQDDALERRPQRRVPDHQRGAARRLAVRRREAQLLHGQRRTPPASDGLPPRPAAAPPKPCLHANDGAGSHTNPEQQATPDQVGGWAATPRPKLAPAGATGGEAGVVVGEEPGLLHHPARPGRRGHAGRDQAGGIEEPRADGHPCERQRAASAEASGRHPCLRPFAGLEARCRRAA